MRLTLYVITSARGCGVLRECGPLVQWVLTTYSSDVRNKWSRPPCICDFYLFSHLYVFQYVFEPPFWSLSSEFDF